MVTVRGWDDDERATLVALLRAQPERLNWGDLTAMVAECGSARKVWSHYYPDTLFGENDASTYLREAQADVQAWRDDDFQFLTFMDDEYPERLRDVRQMPPVVFTQGLLVQADRSVSVVGSRKASTAATAFARQTAKLLVGQGLTVVAGLAEGIDTAAHEAALEAGGRTVAVIGTGIRKRYPASNRDLHTAIVERGGLLLSQFWPDSPPTKWSFPARNAVMSAYGYATVVVAAGEHSGTRIQAREAIGHGRPVILSAAVTRDTRWGATLVGQPGVHVATSPEQVMAHLDKILTANDTVAELLAAATLV